MEGEEGEEVDEVVAVVDASAAVVTGGTVVETGTLL